MNKLLFFALAFLILTIILFVFVESDGKNVIQFVSPIIKNEKVLGVNEWVPIGEDIDGNTIEINRNEQVLSFGNKLQISAKAALFVDSKGGNVLYSKNAKEKLPIASLAKVMTVLIALEHKSLDDKFLVSQRATEMEPDEMILLPGERLTLKELLYGIFMVSANDAAEVLAEGTLRQVQGEHGSREEFIKLMNSKAKQLGMEDTYFVNPTGLDEDHSNSYSTVYDMAILTRYIVRRYPEVVEISKTPYINIAETEDHQSYEMWSGINLLTTYPGVVGFKTGYTQEAGYTLITIARKNGHEVIGVLLGSEYRRDEAKLLLDYSFLRLTKPE